MSWSVYGKYHGYGIRSDWVIIIGQCNDSGRLQYARAPLNRRAGKIVTEAVLRGWPLPRDIVTYEALENACAIVAATGGSTNAALHIPAIANEAGIDFDMDAVANVFERTPLIANLSPGGRYLAIDVHHIGGTAVILRELLQGGYLHGDALTISGQSIATEIEQAPEPDGDIVVSCKQPRAHNGGVTVLRGNLCPEGALLKVAGLKNAEAPRTGTGIRE